MMIRNLTNFLLFCIFFVFCNSTLNGQNLVNNTDVKPLRVGIAGTAPFVINEEGNATPQGISPSIWTEITDDLKWDYNYTRYNSVNQALDALKKGEMDVIVGPVTINSDRLEHFKFSQPYYQSSLAIAYKEGSFSIWNVLKLIFSVKLIFAIGIFLIILTIVGTFLWLAERKASPEQFPADPARGIGTGMWLAIVTMSTTGYGDKAPVTLTGRIIAGTWMIVSIISATSMVAGIASILTFSNFQSVDIQNMEQLSGKKVATIAGSPSVEFLREFKVIIKSAPTIEEAMIMLKNKEVEAIVYDRPQLMYYINNHESENLKIAKAEYYKQGYGFAFQKDSPLTYEVNRTLLELAEDQKILEITEDYLGKDE
ncbi:transporter substrate-binding domain-containing protein [Kaistella polysaccharea]|uniref:transporter substrate-binding domain-containing protein n=1 Tax=Kaistella polysaccharea TaxID=2878534 RepID=UPI001CF141CB|nr:transporter substrate-binding domain-containing protein [Kaistella polysaccharea]